MNANKKLRCCLVTFPISESGNMPLSNLVDILIPLNYKLYLVTGNAGYEFFKDNKRFQVYGINHEQGTTAISIISKYVQTQLKISYVLFKLREKLDFYIFFIGGEGLIIPMLTVKLLNKKVILLPADYTVRVGRDIGSRLLKSLININRILSNRIILYSENLIKEWDLEKYRNKIYIVHRHFLDFDKFKIKTRFNERANLVGYIGRLSEEKGVLNFVNAIPKILKERNDLEFLIGGDGQLRGKIEKYLDKENLNNKVKVTGWIPHDNLPDYLNELKLVILPSHIEGLPNLMLEAMACGTPVLTTPVGAIPDIIKEGETGFVLANNSPECIAENVMRVLKHPDLGRIVENARLLVEREFTYNAAVDRYRKILNGMRCVE